MATRQGITEQLVRIKADEQAADSTLTVTDEVREGLEGIARQALTLRQETKDLAAELKRLEQAWLRGDTVTAQFVATTTELAQKKQKLIEVERDLARAVDDTADSEARAREEALRRQQAELERASLYGRTGRNVQTLTRTVSTLGGAGGQELESALNVGGELLATAGAAGKLKQELPAVITGLVNAAGGVGQLAAATGLAAGAVAGIAIAWKVAKGIIDESAEGTRRWIDINKELAEVLATGTSQQVRETITQNEQRNKVLEREQMMLQQFIDGAANVDGMAGALLDLNDATGLNLGGIEDVKKQLNEVNGELQNNYDVNYQLETALRNGATAANDLAAAERALTDERITALGDEAALWNQFFGATEAQLDAEIERQNVIRDSAEFNKAEAERQKTLEEDRGGDKETLDKWQAEIDRWDATATRAGDAVNYLEGVLRREVQANDAARESIEVYTAAIERRTQSDLDAARMSSEAVDQELEAITIRSNAINRQIEFLRTLAEESPDPAVRKEAAQALAIFEAELQTLTTRQAQLVEVIRPQVEAREAEARALEALVARQKERVADLVAEQNALTERRDILETFIDESVALEQERADEIVKLQADLAQKQMDELAKAYLDQAKLDQKYYQDRQAVLDDLSADVGAIDQDRLDEVRDFNRQLERLTEDHEDNILQIKKNADRDLGFAMARLDAMSIWRIQQQMADQLEAEDKSYQKSKDLLEEQITDRLTLLERERDEARRTARDRLADLKTGWETERAERMTEAEQRIADLQTQADQRRGELQAQWATEDAERQAHTAKLLGLTESEFAELLATTRAKYGDIKAEWKTQLEDMVAIVTDKMTAARQAIQQVWDTLTGLNLGAALGGIDLFQTGGIKQRTGLAHLESGEGVMVPTVTDAYTRAMGGSFSQEGLMRILDSALGRGGPQVSVGQVQFPITIGNAGDYSPDELVQIIHDGVRYHFAEMIRGGIAGAG